MPINQLEGIGHWAGNNNAAADHCLGAALRGDRLQGPAASGGQICQAIRRQSVAAPEVWEDDHFSSGWGLHLAGPAVQRLWFNGCGPGTGDLAACGCIVLALDALQEGPLGNTGPSIGFFPLHTGGKTPNISS